jgi:hypothetical protein
MASSGWQGPLLQWKTRSLRGPIESVDVDPIGTTDRNRPLGQPGEGPTSPTAAAINPARSPA